MNSSVWLRVYHHEISRRKRLWAENPKKAAKVFAQNPKRLADCCDGEHVWVPASTLWIHDNGKGAYKIGGYWRRGLREAHPYKDADFQVTPQMCWYCIKTRDKRMPLISWSQRQRTLAEHILLDKKSKPRGRKGAETMIEDYDEL